MTQMVFLQMGANDIVDISALSGMTRLETLWIDKTQVADISPLAGLIALNDIHLEGSLISDLTPLLENPGLGEGDTVDVTGNPLSEEALFIQIPELRNRGVVVVHPNIPPKALAGPDQTVGVNTTIQLDASASFDPDGDNTTFLWSQTGGPTVALSDPQSMSPEFVPPEPDVYEFTLVVSDSSAASKPDTLSVTVTSVGEPSGEGRLPADISGKMAFAAYGQRSSGDWDIHVVDGAGLWRVTDNSARDESPVWSPDGTEIAFLRSQSSGGGQVWIIDENGGNERQLTFTESGIWNSPIDWSPDSDRILFDSGRGSGGMFTMDTNGGNVTKINDATLASSGGWSPDGQYVAYLPNDLQTIRIEESDTYSLVREISLGESVIAQQLRWSPDGRMFAVWHGVALLLVSVDGTQIESIPLPDGAGFMNWTPDGRRIVFENFPGRIFTTDLEGNVEQLDLPFGEAYRPSFYIPRPIEIAQPITFADPNLEAAVREAISKSIGDILTEDVAELRQLDAKDRNITALAGIESLISLEILDIIRNQIGDISSLAGLKSLVRLEINQNIIGSLEALSDLTSLQILSAFGNQIRDISPLTDLTSLTWLELGQNLISDVNPLSGLTRMEFLSLPDNQISDISSLAGMTRIWLLDINNNRVTDISSLSRLTALDQLYLERNEVTDISVVSNFVALTVLRFSDNQVTDISSVRSLGALREVNMRGNQVEDLAALVENEGVASGDTVNVTGNPLSEEALYDQIPQLRNRGVVVIYPNIPPKALAGPDQTGEVNATMQLDGSASFDPDGDSLDFLWSQTDGPTESLSDPRSMTPTFVPSEPANYSFSLVVNDGTADSEPDEMVITVNESGQGPPVNEFGENPPEVSFMPIPEDGRFVDLTGDVTYEPVDILQATFSVTEEQIVVTITVSSIPEELTFNGPDIEEDDLEYWWFVHIDVDFDDRQDFTIGIAHFKYEPTITGDILSNTFHLAIEYDMSITMRAAYPVQGVLLRQVPRLKAIRFDSSWTRKGNSAA